MRFGICAPFQDVAKLPRISFDYLEEHVQRFLIPEQPRAQFAALLAEARALPVPIEAANSFFPPHLPLIATPTRPIDAARIERYVKTALQRAQESGIRILVFGSGGARACPEGYAREEAVRQLADHLATWCEWARPYGVEIALEPLSYTETNMLNTVAESGALVSSIAQTGARLLADIYHMENNREDAETILPWAALLAHVHVAEREGRSAPGQHGDDFRQVFSVLRRGNYDQRISIECHWHDLATEAEQGIAVLREQWAASAFL